MPTPPSSIAVQQLGFIRHLYEGGAVESGQPTPLSSEAILSLHDAVELFLGLAAEHLGVNVNLKIQFMEYWGEINKTVSVELPGKSAMSRLNNARVALKHHGNHPSSQTIERSLADVTAFFASATQLVFGVDFSTLDMADLVPQKDVAQLLREAQLHADQSDHVQAFAGLSLALDALLAEYSRPRTRYGRIATPYSFGPDFGAFDKPEIGGRHGNERIKKLQQVAETMQAALLVMALGIDYPSYSRFRVIASSVWLYANGDRRYTVPKRADLLTADEYSWARHFVISSALHAAGSDEVLELHKTVVEELPQGVPEERRWDGPPAANGP